MGASWYPHHTRIGKRKRENMVYEYECSNCGQITEVSFPISAKKPKVLPCGHCQSCAKLIISRSNFFLRGGGWYKDGYEKKPNPSPAPT